MKDLIFVQVCPDNSCFWWQTAVQLNNLRKFGYSNKYHALIFLSRDDDKNGFNGKWKFLEKKFPEAHFHYYRDEENVIETAKMISYIPLLRPYCLRKFCEERDMSNTAMFYFDSDVIFTQPLDIQKYVDDDINYLSYTGVKKNSYNYICHDHFVDKEKNIKIEKWKDYFDRDVLGKMVGWFGINKQEFIDKKDNIGGAQYLLKNVDASFFEEVYNGCIVVRTFLSSANQEFMEGNTNQEKEDNGWQSWCADMWSVLLTLWHQGKETQTPKEMDFCWATDKVDKWTEASIYHDAGGATNPDLFNKKGKLKDGKWTYMHAWDNDDLSSPFQEKISASEEYCSSKYVEEIIETKNYLLR